MVRSLVPFVKVINVTTYKIPVDSLLVFGIKPLVL